MAAATMHAKINRKKLDKLNIVKICEEILNPSVPMALRRLSGILMGGVVVVYEQKVKLLFDDVSRLLVEINEAWKIKLLPDPTVLPTGKSQAKSVIQLYTSSSSSSSSASSEHVSYKSELQNLQCVTEVELLKLF